MRPMFYNRNIEVRNVSIMTKNPELIVPLIVKLIVSKRNYIALLPKKYGSFIFSIIGAFLAD